ncbi:MAG: ECF transporter S component [Massilioclostridium sp.]|nr:ECF transporter S component [Massilioclostridium sp.]
MRTKFNPVAFAKARKKRTILSALIIFLLIPFTVFVGIRFFDDQKYLIVSLFIVLYTMLPFFLVFEKRRPRAREIVVIAVMAALTICGNLLTYLFIPFQAGTALVIVAGVSFGPEAGFLVGALARFVCNFFQGQGPWTPWQMFCWGLLGFLAGLVFNKVNAEKANSRDFKVILGPVVCVLISVGLAFGIHLIWGQGSFLGWQLYIFGAVGLLAGVLIQRKRLPVDSLTLALFGFLTVFIIYGGIMNTAAMIMTSAIPASNISISWESLTLLYLSGVPYDAMHAAGTAFFLFIFGEQMVRKMERVKVKYRLYL